ncbi:MAG: beta-lactamase family protein [Akkermansiaceae bacterium]|nr:beta-lactamase family protein [Armatimonadota bacterium]
MGAFVREQRERHGTPGVSLAVVSADRVVYACGFGVTSADPAQSVAVTPETLFRVGSTTKAMTGTLLMRLVEAEKLSLDEPVVTYLPWLTLSDNDATARVTLRHLMSHQSGLPWGAGFFGDRDPSGLETYVRTQVPLMPLIAPPGVLFSYSNIGVNVSGCVAEAVGGAPFAELMYTWVFEPLGMERTLFDPLRAMAFPLAQAHARTEAGVRVQREEPWAENVAYRPSAMAYSTVLDTARFARLHLNQGKWDGQQLLSAESVAEMQKTQVDEYQTDGRTVGLNFALSYYRGHRRVGHGGGIASFGSVFTMLPDAGVAVAIQFNENGFWQATEEIVRQVFDAVLQHSSPACAVPTVPLPPEPKVRDRERCAGTFLGPRSGLVVLSVNDDENSIRLSRRGTGGDVPLLPLRRDLYAGRNLLTGEEEVVGCIGLTERHGAEPITHIMLNGAPCVRVEPDPAFAADPHAWHAYIGEFRGADETYPSGFDRLTLRCENDILRVFSLNRAREEEAIPWEEGCFVYRGRFLRFPKDDPAPMSFTLGDPVVRYERLG